jgi:hypothetical protein
MLKILGADAADEGAARWMATRFMMSKPLLDKADFLKGNCR